MTTNDAITAHGAISANSGSFRPLSIMGTTTWTPIAPTSRIVFIRLVSAATGGIEICADNNQYIDVTTMTKD